MPAQLKKLLKHGTNLSYSSMGNCGFPLLFVNCWEFGKSLQKIQYAEQICRKMAAFCFLACMQDFVRFKLQKDGQHDDRMTFNLK